MSDDKLVPITGQALFNEPGQWECVTILGEISALPPSFNYDGTLTNPELWSGMRRKPKPPIVRWLVPCQYMDTPPNVYVDESEQAVNDFIARPGNHRILGPAVRVEIPVTGSAK